MTADAVKTSHALGGEHYKAKDEKTEKELD